MTTEWLAVNYEYNAKYCLLFMHSRGWPNPQISLAKDECVAEIGNLYSLETKYSANIMPWNLAKDNTKCGRKQAISCKVLGMSAINQLIQN